MKKNNKGFTLAELLIVVAIVAVLTAIAIPIFNTQLEKAREATDTANARDYYAEIAVALVDGTLVDEDGSRTLQVSGGLTATATFDSGNLDTVYVSGIKINQKQADWQTGTPSIAGVTVSDCPTSTDTKIIYDFETNDGHTALVGITWDAS